MKLLNILEKLINTKFNIFLELMYKMRQIPNFFFILNQKKYDNFYKIITNKTIYKTKYYYLRNNKNNDTLKKIASFYSAAPHSFIKIVLRNEIFLLKININI